MSVFLNQVRKHMLVLLLAVKNEGLGAHAELSPSSYTSGEIYNEHSSPDESSGFLL